MKVKLIQMTQNPIDVMWVAARTCYSEKSPIEMWEDTIKQQFVQKLKDDCSGYEEKDEINQKHWNLVKKVLDSGHQSIAETIVFTFSIEGVSRSLTHQLVRHRLCCYSQQSQRYVNFKDKVFNYAIPDIIERKEGAKKIYEEFMEYCKSRYDELIDLGIPAEDARYVLPNGACTNINMTANLRELMHIASLRLCSRASKEIRDLFKLIKAEVTRKDERLGDLLKPTCEINGICFEDRCCGRKPTLKEVLEAHELVEADTVLSKNDWSLLIELIENPQVNEKLQNLMKMKSVIEEEKK